MEQGNGSRVHDQTEVTMAQTHKRGSGSDRSPKPGRVGGDAARKAQRWSGGSKGSKGAVTRADKRNENSTSKGR
jgi:hypothetical protein